MSFKAQCEEGQASSSYKIIVIRPKESVYYRKKIAKCIPIIHREVVHQLLFAINDRFRTMVDQMMGINALRKKDNIEHRIRAAHMNIANVPIWCVSEIVNHQSVTIYQQNVQGARCSVSNIL